MRPSGARQELRRKASAAMRASAKNAGTAAATITSTLQGESRHSRAARAARATAFWTTVKACITRESGRAEASRRAFCILS